MENVIRSVRYKPLLHNLRRKAGFAIGVSLIALVGTGSVGEKRRWQNRGEKYEIFEYAPELDKRFYYFDEEKIV